MTQVKLNTIIHALVMFAGILGIILANAATLGLPAVVVSALPVTIIILMYVSNQLPGLGSNSSAAAVNAAKELGSEIKNISEYTTFLGK